MLPACIDAGSTCSEPTKDGFILISNDRYEAMLCNSPLRSNGTANQLKELSPLTVTDKFLTIFDAIFHISVISVRHESAPPLVAESATERISYLALGIRR